MAEKVRLVFCRRILTQVIFFPWKSIRRRRITASAINALLHRYTDAVIINPDIIGTAGRPKNSI